MKKNLLKLYDKQYFSERDYLPSHLLNTLEIFLKENKVKDVLEVGAGSGKLMKALRERGYSVEGIDISPISAKLSGAKVASATKIPFKAQSFDCLLAISIIEHLSKKDGEIFINEARRVLRNNGVIFIVTPNFSSPARYLKKEKWFGYSDKSHIFFYTPKSLRKLLLKNNFKNVKLTFKITSSKLEWPLPAVFYKLPTPFRYLTNYLLISTPLALVRDSIWVGGNKK
jgi:ubiquinone/menaquinone biosynthesis C-methylase UbiE